MRLPAKFQKLDRIILSDEDVDKIFKWRDSNKTDVRQFRNVLDKGVIETSAYYIIFEKIDGSVYQYTIFYKSGILALRFTTSILPLFGYKRRDEVINVDHEVVDGLAESLVSIHASCMAFMEHYVEEKDIILQRKENLGESRKKVAKKGARPMSRIIYHIKEVPFSVERKYTRRTSGWTVRGHWRTLPTGRRIWIRPHTKGKKIEPSKYKL